VENSISFKSMLKPVPPSRFFDNGSLITTTPATIQAIVIGKQIAATCQTVIFNIAAAKIPDWYNGQTGSQICRHQKFEAVFTSGEASLLLANSSTIGADTIAPPGIGNSPMSAGAAWATDRGLIYPFNALTILSRYPCFDRIAPSTTTSIIVVIKIQVRLADAVSIKGVKNW